MDLDAFRGAAIKSNGDATAANKGEKDARIKL
jgi:hypothetical protein